MFGHIAGVYDLLNHVLSLGIDRSWRKELAMLAPDEGLFLDLAAGTLDVAIALQRMRPASTVLALDFCVPMLERGRQKLDTREQRDSILPCAGDALDLPVADDSASCITIAFGIRNIEARAAAFAEMLRALKPGGRVCVLEFGSAQEKIWYGFYNLYLARILPFIGRLIARDKQAYSYLARTIREFPSAPALADEMENAGFINVGYLRLTGGIVCIHTGEKPGDS